jgi:hypothetical protein
MVRPIDDEAKKFGWLTLEVTEVRGDQLAGRVVDCAPWLQVEAGISLGHEMTFTRGHIMAIEDG